MPGDDIMAKCALLALWPVVIFSSGDGLHFFEAMLQHYAQSG
jgi:hypothetical protein